MGRPGSFFANTKAGRKNPATAIFWPQTWGEIMVHHVLLVTDTEKVHEESFFYARELAKRMNLALHTLILGSYAASDDERRLVEQALDDIIASARAEGISATGSSKFGDQASELLKYLAIHPGTQCLVWGGDPGVMREGNKKHSSHWLLRVRSELDCPIAGATGKKT